MLVGRAGGRRIRNPIPIVSGGPARPAAGNDLSEKRATYLHVRYDEHHCNADSPTDQERHGTFDADGVYVPRKIVEDDLGDMSFEDAIDQTIVAFDDGDIVTGKVVKVDKDEVLLDIGFKSEGVIPARELSIRHDLDPHEVVSVGEEIEALVLQKEDKEGRLILSKKRAQYERAWGTSKGSRNRAAS